MVIRSRAPLRLGLAGGGTDLLSYSNEFGGAVFNATISMYAYCTITPRTDKKIHFAAPDRQEEFVLDAKPRIETNEPLVLHKAVYNRIVKDYNGGKPLSFSISTSADAPAGSGLGTSSTMVVAILEAFNRWLKLGIQSYEMAELAYKIEREDLGLAGGKQDQYSAVFGGFNFMEFKTDKSVVINSLRMDKKLINELECALLLFYSGRSRSSSDIIKEQIKNTSSHDSKSLNAMHALRENAYAMKDAILKGDFKFFAESLRTGWANKKNTASIISNQELETIIKFAEANGAEALKVSGAGGGGFIMMFCNPVNRQKLFDALKQYKGVVFPVSFTKYGVESWVTE